jgi:hypothetical protein
MQENLTFEDFLDAGKASKENYWIFRRLIWWPDSATVVFSTTQTFATPAPATSLPVESSDVYRGRSWYNQGGGGDHETSLSCFILRHEI